MRLLKLGIISIIIFGLMIMAISLLMPSTIFVSRSIHINAPEDTVYAYIGDLKKWKLWSADMDSVPVSYSLQTTGKGAIAVVGKTTVTISDISDKKLSAMWQTNASMLNGSFSFLPNEKLAGTSLQWQIVHHLPWYPWEKFAAIFSDKAIGNFMEKSLDKLKVTIEK